MTRVQTIIEQVRDRGLDGLLVSEPYNLRWLTGFTGSSGLAVVGPELLLFITDFRYVEQAAEQVADGFEHVLAQPELLSGLAQGLSERGGLRLGFDDEHVTVKEHRRLGEVLSEVELVPAGGMIEQARAVKDERELSLIRAAAQIADEALGEAIHDGLAGRTERDVAFALDAALRARGAEPSFATIVAAGPHGALPHAEPRAVEIPANTLVVIDWGARVDGYCSDCTRTLATGELDDEALATYNLVRRAQQAALDAVRPGPSGREVDAVARELIERAGHGEHFGHGLGHGVGLEVHEAPRLSRLGDAPLLAGNVVTVEPGVYLPGRLGVRIEDLVVVTEHGHDVLSGHTKALWTVT